MTTTDILKAALRRIAEGPITIEQAQVVAQDALNRAERDG